MEIHRFGPDELDGAMAFFGRIPDGDLTFIKEDVHNRDVVAAWTRDERSRRYLAIDDQGTVVGYVAVIPGLGWSSHVGELRLVIDPDQRRQGIGRTLARKALSEAIDLGLGKIVVEVVAEQAAPIAMFQGLGFHGEALLTDHVRDRGGNLRDLVVLAHAVADNEAVMSASGITEALA